MSAGPAGGSRRRGRRCGPPTWTRSCGCLSVAAGAVATAGRRCSPDAESAGKPLGRTGCTAVNPVATHSGGVRHVANHPARSISSTGTHAWRQRSTPRRSVSLQWGGPYGKDGYLVDAMNVVWDQKYRLFRSGFTGSHTGVVAQFGMIGMGRNLALNILDHDYSVARYNLGPELMQPASSSTQLVSGISRRGYASRGGAPSATSRPE